MSKVPFIRTPRPEDAGRLADLAAMALHGGDMTERVREMAAHHAVHGDMDQVETNRGPVRFVATTRVMDAGDGEVVGYVYCAPPMDWIMRHSGLPSVRLRTRLAASLVEVNLLAVMPKWRRRGVASRLLADCEARYAAEGYRMMMVVFEGDQVSLAPWYGGRGYALTDVDEPAQVRFWESREISGLYGSVTSSQRMGFKPLVEGARVGRRVVEVPVWRREARMARFGNGHAAQASGLVPVEGTAQMRDMVVASGVFA